MNCNVKCLVGLLILIIFAVTSLHCSTKGQYYVHVTLDSGPVLKYENLTKRQYDSFWLCDTEPNSKLDVGTVKFADDFVNSKAGNK